MAPPMRLASTYNAMKECFRQRRDVVGTLLGRCLDLDSLFWQEQNFLVLIPGIQEFPPCRGQNN
jgi:hypothetical protein